MKNVIARIFFILMSVLSINVNAQSEKLEVSYFTIREATLGRGPVTVDRLVGYWVSAGTISSSECRNQDIHRSLNVLLKENKETIKIEKTELSNFVVYTDNIFSRGKVIENMLNFNVNFNEYNLGAFEKAGKLYVAIVGSNETTDYRPIEITTGYCKNMFIYKKL